MQRHVTFKVENLDNGQEGSTRWGGIIEKSRCESLYTETCDSIDTEGAFYRRSVEMPRRIWSERVVKCRNLCSLV